MSPTGSRSEYFREEIVLGIVRLELFNSILLLVLYGLLKYTPVYGVFVHDVFSPLRTLRKPPNFARRPEARQRLIWFSTSVAHALLCDDISYRSWQDGENQAEFCSVPAKDAVSQQNSNAGTNQPLQVRLLAGRPQPRETAAAFSIARCRLSLSNIHSNK